MTRAQLLLAAFAAGLSLILSGSGLAQGAPAAERAFERFAGDWMKGLAAQGNELEDAARYLRPASGGGDRNAVVQKMRKDHKTETQETGKAAAPYVGILSYTEETWLCIGPSQEDCELVDSMPITEIFPFHDGAWRY